MEIFQADFRYSQMTEKDSESKWQSNQGDDKSKYK